MTGSLRFRFSYLLLGTLAAVPLTHAESPEKIDFQRDVRPILSDNCFACHGPDEATRLAGLRLDTHDGAFQKRDSGTPLVAGDLQASLLYQRITTSDAARQMPPSYSNKKLSDEQVDVLKRWIEQGASWDQLWSFQAITRPELPAVKQQEWVRNSIDRFILARLEQEGLEPAPEADRHTLIRRLSLDLRGLPPSPEEVERFVNDKSSGAYEELVDRLLDSPQWGEHRARYWLDAARYADTHGLHIDNYREMWPYRDWVINAFNNNMPFDQFTVEQIAGDLLPNPTLDQRIATGFHRCNVTTNEAGVIIEEVEAIYAKDRADTTGTVWLGLTVGCATCHDHKFDPILTKDFYSMTAFFRNTTQDAMDGNVSDTPPIVVVPEVQDRDRWQQLRQEISELSARMEETRQGAGFDDWIKKGRYRALQSPLEPKSELLSLSLEGKPAAMLGKKSVSLDLPAGVTLGEGPEPGRKAVRFADPVAVELPQLKSIDARKPFSLTAWIYMPDSDGNFVVASQSDSEDKGRGWSFNVFARVAGFSLTGDDGKSIDVRAGHLQQMKVGTWNHLAMTYDGSGERAGMNFFLNGEVVPLQGSEYFAKLQGDIRVDQPVRLGASKGNGFAGGAIADFRIFDRPITAEEARIVSLWPAIEQARAQKPAQLNAAQRDALQLYHLNLKDKNYRKLVHTMGELATEQRNIRRRGSVTLVMHERTDRKPMAHILKRGQYDQPGEEVEPAVPVALPPMPASFPKNRLGLAKWLVEDANPLTARVTVNRFWQQIFGTGIVKTSDDLGSQGEPPSHPQLLDWLAAEFRDKGWDVKKLFKLMATSATYRQAAATTPRKIDKDPDNRLLSRGPRFRLDGEIVRDYTLAASGLIEARVGGPSVKPYQPEGVWETVAMEGSNTRFYKQDQGDKLYRRSLYTFWKRAAPPPSMDIFNAPTRETCTVQRERTNTPLQALVTMNGPQFVEASRHLAQTALTSAGEQFDRQLDYVTLRLLARRFNERERQITKQAYADYLRYYESHADDAKSLLATGESQPDMTLPLSESAALTMVASQIMNLDEALNK